VSYTKYVITEDGTFALVSKYTGVEHSTLGHYVGGPHKVVRAGFLYLNPEGQLDSYGKSISTGKESDPEDGKLIQAALERGEVILVENEQAFFYYATNRAEDRQAKGAEVADLDLLKKHRVIERHD
jgi:hypothetical protein